MLPDKIKDKDVNFMRGIDVNAFLNKDISVPLLCFLNYFDSILVFKKNNETLPNFPFSHGWSASNPPDNIKERFEKTYSVFEEMMIFSFHMVENYKEKYNGEYFFSKEILKT